MGLQVDGKVTAYLFFLHHFIMQVCIPAAHQCHWETHVCFNQNLECRSWGAGVDKLLACLFPLDLAVFSWNRHMMVLIAVLSKQDLF